MSRNEIITIPLDLWTHHILNFIDIDQLFELLYINKDFHYNITNNTINNPTSIRFNNLKNIFNTLLLKTNNQFHLICDKNNFKIVQQLNVTIDFINCLILQKEFYFLHYFCNFLLEENKLPQTSNLVSFPIITVLSQPIYNYTIWENKKLTINLIKYNNVMIHNIKKEWLLENDIIEAVIEGSREGYRLYEIFNSDYKYSQSEVPFPINYDITKIFTKNNLNFLKLALTKCNFEFLNITYIKELIDDLIYNDLNMEILSLVINVDSYSKYNFNKYKITDCIQKLEELYGADTLLNCKTMTINLLCKILREYNGLLIQHIKDENIKNNIDIILNAIHNNFNAYLYIDNNELRENERVLCEMVSGRWCSAREFRRIRVLRCLELFQMINSHDKDGNYYVEKCAVLLAYFCIVRSDLRYRKEVKEAFQNLKEETFLEKILPKLEFIGKRSKNGLIMKLLPRSYLFNELFLQKVIKIKPELEKTIVACKKYLNIKV
ncbi:hypothetical protein ABK040_013666 [Willaertia magna]